MHVSYGIQMYMALEASVAHLLDVIDNIVTKYVSHEKTLEH